MRPTIIAGNWKMNPSLTEASHLIKSLTQSHIPTTTQVIIIPPFTLLSMIHTQLQNSTISLGAQTLSQHKNGAYTGEISASILQEIGCQYVLIGHSERRQYHNENNTVLNQKVHQALNHQLTPIYCVGETLEERKSNQTLNIIKTQLTEGLAQVSAKKPPNTPIIIAYEPVWAIGTGQVASPEQAEEVHHYIREQLQTLIGTENANHCPILYGGSVKPNNSESLFQQPNIDGGLIGGASLNSKDFSEIINSSISINQHQ